MTSIKSQLTTGELYGLVLAGGKSSRFGKDKGTIQWHGKEHRYFIADLLRPFCNKVFISCRKEQSNRIDKNYEVIYDTYENIGPYAAVLSAFEKNNKCAWLIVACDLPLLDSETVAQMVQQRDPDCIATAFKNPQDGLPEPLLTIWEPCSRHILLSSLSNGCQSLRSTLINNNTKVIEAKNDSALVNINRPEELKQLQLNSDFKHQP